MGVTRLEFIKGALVSLGEQIQQTNFAQHGDRSDVSKLRGGYAERWTVLWLTAHFLNAAAEFSEMGVGFQGAKRTEL